MAEIIAEQAAARVRELCWVRDNDVVAHRTGANQIARCGFSAPADGRRRAVAGRLRRPESDYGQHAMTLLRPHLPEDTWKAAELTHDKNGQWMRIVGNVICRQRPGTAKGFVFVSMEGETGTGTSGRGHHSHQGRANRGAGKSRSATCWFTRFSLKVIPCVEHIQTTVLPSKRKTA